MCVVGVSWHWACCPGVLPQSKTTDLDCEKTKSATSPDTSQNCFSKCGRCVWALSMLSWTIVKIHGGCSTHTTNMHLGVLPSATLGGGQAAVCSAQWSASCMLSCCPCSKPNVDDLVPRGLEPRTLRLLAARSDQLSYETSGEGSLSRCSPRARAAQGKCSSRG